MLRRQLSSLTSRRSLFLATSSSSTAIRFCSDANNKNTHQNFKSWFEWVQKEAIPQYQKQPQQEQQQNNNIPQPPSNVKPPAWFEKLCEDLYFRKDSEGYDDMARDSGESIRLKKEEEEGGKGRGSSSYLQDENNNNNSREESIDPFLWLEFNIFPEEQYRFETFKFPFNLEQHFTPECKNTLIGNEQKTMCCFASGYKFPDRRQLPVTVGTESSYLWVDPSRPDVPVVYIQLNPIFPPSMWLPVKATAKAIRRVFAEFATTAAVHRDRHEPYWERKWIAAKTALSHTNNEKLRSDPGAILRLITHAASQDNTYEADIVKEFHNSQEFFLGEYADPESEIQKFIDLCPTIFSTPIFRTNVNLHDEHVPMIDGPGVATSLYRCVYSKALLLVQTHLSTEVKLPPLDHDAFKMLWSDSGSPPPSKVPVFVRVIWPASDGEGGENDSSAATKTARMAGGGHINRYLNSKLGTEFAHDVPVDAVFSLLYISQWIKRPQDFLGVHGMRQRLLEIEDRMLNPPTASEQLEEKSSNNNNNSDTNSLVVKKKQQQEHVLGGADGSTYPGTAEIPSPHYTPEEELAMHIQYSAHLQDPLARDTIIHYMTHHSAAIRTGCAKAALEIGDRALFKKIAQNEPDGRFKYFLAQLVRKRKARDLFDQEIRVDDGQFELPPPIWARRVRIDPSSRDGQRYFGRSKIRGAIGTQKSVKRVNIDAKEGY